MSGNDDNSNEVDQVQRQEQMLLQQQIDQNSAEIEEKRQSVFTERLNIINANRGQSWTPYKPMANKKPKSIQDNPNAHQIGNTGLYRVEVPGMPRKHSH